MTNIYTLITKYTVINEFPLTVCVIISFLSSAGHIATLKSIHATVYIVYLIRLTSILMKFGELGSQV